MALAHNNAFGPNSPSWNLAFPEGNLTAAELLAYLPHWLKSIDVIDRFVTHGAKSSHIAALINEFRDLPTGTEFKPNSAMIMMQVAMRRAGYDDWSVTTHMDFPREIARPEGDLDVKDFRAPRLTHPKDVRTATPQKVAANMEAEPIDFKDLALHVKQHPTGSDALDLARCVQYALDHPHEEWLFPTDFRRLTIHLGGPARITQAHHDRQVFARHDKVVFSPSNSTPSKNCTPIRRRTPGGKRTPNTTVTPSRTMKTRVSDIMAEVLSGSAAPQKRLAESLGRVDLGSTRRSGRLVGKKINFGENSEIDGSGKDFLDSPYTTPKKHKLSRIPPTPKSGANDSDFEGASESDEDVPDAEDAFDDEELFSLTPARGRKAARKARFKIQKSLVSEHRSPLKPRVSKLPSPQMALPSYMTAPISAEAMNAALAYPARQPIHLPTPALSANRLKIDDFSIYLYSLPPHTNIDDMYASAYSFSRFGGPRHSAPFRELHLLGEPDKMDMSDWAENVRWAKEQYMAFRSVWTEYDYYLECITEHRRAINWVSEEAVMAGMVSFGL